MASSRPPAPEPELVDLDEYTESINMLVYADPGTGKTVLGGTGNGLILSTEAGTISARRAGSKAKTVLIQDWRQFARVLVSLQRTGEFKGFRPDWVVIDTLTELQSLLIQDILADPPDGRQRQPDTLQIQDYGTLQHRFKRVIHTVNALPHNVLYTCHAMRAEDEEGDPIILPDLSGKWGTQDATTASRWTCGTVHAYGYLKVVRNKEDQEVRRWMFKRSGPYFGKDRYGVLSPYVDSPNLLDIATLVNGTNTPQEG